MPGYGLYANTASGGAGWVNPNGAASGGGTATYSLTHGVTSTSLIGTNYGFDLQSIPDNATITDVQVQYSASATSYSSILRTAYVWLVNSGSQIGNQYAGSRTSLINMFNA